MEPTGPLAGARNLRELDALARAKLPAMAYDYIAGGAEDERTLGANEAAFRGWRLVHRVLRDVSRRDPATTVLGQRVAFPALAAPTAFHKLAHPEGEAATARGVAAAGTLFIASTLSTVALEEVARASQGPKWFQVYVYRDRKLTEALVERAVRADYEALVLTVDAPVWGRRERDLRHGFSLPQGLGLANFAHLPQELLPKAAPGASGLQVYVREQLDPSLTWEAVDWLRDLSGLPVVVKGLVHPDDARLAVEHGAAGVVVSNHGGRQLDAGIGTLDALPAVVEAVQGRSEVFLDGGVRRGTDVMVALALGARAVLVGRPLLWALALDGAAGVEAALRMLRDEFDAAMALCGAASVAALHRGLLARA